MPINLRSLGDAYIGQLENTSADGLQQGIDCYNLALEFYSEQDTPREWADLKFRLGESYVSLAQVDIGNARKNAISAFQDALRVYTDDAFPNEAESAKAAIAKLRSS